jgi:hypothetical protein
VGFATSMESVPPRDLKLSAKRHQPIASLARNEKESFQVLVAPFERDLKGWRCYWEFAIRERILFAATNIHAAPVGYVEFKSVRPTGLPAWAGGPIRSWIF